MKRILTIVLLIGISMSVFGISKDEAQRRVQNAQENKTTYQNLITADENAINSITNNTEYTHANNVLSTIAREIVWQQRKFDESRSKDEKIQILEKIKDLNTRYATALEDLQKAAANIK